MARFVLYREFPNPLGPKRETLFITEYKGLIRVPEAHLVLFRDTYPDLAPCTNGSSDDRLNGLSEIGFLS